MNRVTKVRVLAAVMAVLAGGVVAAPEAVAAYRPPVAATPPMGWSSWSSLRTAINEQAIEAQAKVMHDSLARYGYDYVNIDAGWSDHVDEYGRNAANATRFPNGIAAVAKYVHGLGLKFGIYLVPGGPEAAVAANSAIKGTPYHVGDIADPSVPGNTADDGSARIDFSKPGADAYVRSQADLLASWGVDYIKMDFVGPGGGNVVADNRPDVQHWQAALRATGRLVHLELSNSLSFADVDTWQRYSNGWRIEGDIECYSHCVGLTNWDVRVKQRFTDVPKWVPHAGPGHWNDLDSVEVGNGASDGLSADEKQSVVTLWSIEGAPLLLGTDLTKLDPADLPLITNREVIAVDQAGRPAHPVSQATPQQTWVSSDGHGGYTVALFNLGSTSATVTANWSDLGVRGPALVRDLWAHRDLGVARGSFSATLAPHASRLVKVVPF
ncbi:glycoside hydrolase family 27 protein [Amycolatopsis sp. NPDC050768]|uniref:glycoside hydrolase family 27 protein n=1 Tax=Amycolatopsis sp. NPDC050768 TaxID=3154839 RepID=UPI00340A9B46